MRERSPRPTTSPAGLARAVEPHDGCRELPRLPRRHRRPPAHGRDALRPSGSVHRVVTRDVIYRRSDGGEAVCLDRLRGRGCSHVFTRDHRGHWGCGEVPRPSSEDRFKNRGVSACAVCDRGNRRGSTADPWLWSAAGTRLAKKLPLLSPNSPASSTSSPSAAAASRASKIMADRALSHPKVRPAWNAVVTEVLGNDDRGMTGVRLLDHLTGTIRDVDAAGLFLAIGHTPRTGFLKGRLATHPTGHLVLEPPSPGNGQRPHAHVHRRGFRRRRRGGPALPPGGHRRRQRVHGLCSTRSGGWPGRWARAMTSGESL